MKRFLVTCDLDSDHLEYNVISSQFSLDCALVGECSGFVTTGMYMCNFKFYLLIVYYSIDFNLFVVKLFHCEAASKCVCMLHPNTCTCIYLT